MSQELQYTFSLQNHISFKEEDYIISSCNIEAYNWIKQWPDWGESVYNNFTFMSGDSFSGKSHLSSIWSKYSGAKLIDSSFILDKKYIGENDNYILDNLELTPLLEVALFHFINYMIETKGFCLIISRYSQAKLQVSLKDLESRLKAFPSIKINEPDNMLIDQVIMKYFSDYQISITQEAIKFLRARVDRSYKALFFTLELLNKQSLSQKKKISIGFIKNILQL